jgi:hypothetical protein
MICEREYHSWNWQHLDEDEVLYMYKQILVFSLLLAFQGYPKLIVSGSRILNQRILDVTMSRLLPASAAIEKAGQRINYQPLFKANLKLLHSQVLNPHTPNTTSVFPEWRVCSTSHHAGTVSQ